MIAGRILIIPKGEYSDTTTYTQLDLVFYNNTSWLCRKECKGVKPSSATSEYWYKFSAIALANNLTTNFDGYALDAKQGVVIKTQLDTLSGNVSALAGNVSALAGSIDTLLSQNVAEIYQTNKTYVEGDFVVYDNKLYEAKGTTSGEFNPDMWDEAYIMTSIDDRVDAVLDELLSDKLTAITGMIGEQYSDAITYDIGSVVVVGEKLYRCVEDITLPEEFDSIKWEEVTAAGVAAEATRNLIAQNGTPFKFGYDSETEQYGLIVDGEFRPFSSGGVDPEALYSALQYSGLVTPDMSVDQMLEVLANYFPSMTPLFMNGTVNTSLTGGFKALAAKVNGGHVAKAPTLTVSNAMIITQQSNTTGGTVATNSLVDLSNYNKIVIESSGRWNVSSTDQSTVVVSPSFPTNYNPTLTVPITSNTMEIDISRIKGLYYIGICTLVMNTARTINVSKLYLSV